MRNRLYLLRRRVKNTRSFRRDFPNWTLWRCWREAGEVQRWSLLILSEIVRDREVVA